MRGKVIDADGHILEPIKLICGKIIWKPNTKTGLKHLPSEYFARQCWISFDPDETTIPYVAQKYGAEKLMWASDFPHWDGSLNALEETQEAIAPLSPHEQQLILGDNVAQIYNLS